MHKVGYLSDCAGAGIDAASLSPLSTEHVTASDVKMLHWYILMVIMFFFFVLTIKKCFFIS